MLKCERVFGIKYTGAILSNSARGKLFLFEISKMLIAVLKNKFTMSFAIIFGTPSFPRYGMNWTGRCGLGYFRLTLHSKPTYWRKNHGAQRTAFSNI